MTPVLEAKLEAYFEKLDKISVKMDELLDARDWQASFIQTELGYKPHPESEDVEGRVYKELRKSCEELGKDFKKITDSIQTTLQGTDVSYGVSTKTNIMWKAHFPIWAAITSGITGILVYFLAKTLGK